MVYTLMQIGNILLIDVFGAALAMFTLAISIIPKLEKVETKTNYWKEVKEGIKIVTSNRNIKFIFIVSAIFLIVYMPVSSLYPLMSMDYFNGTSTHVGIVEICFASGMLLGSLAISNKKYFQDKRKNITISIFIIAITLFLSGILPNNMFIPFCILCFLMGSGGPLFNATTATIFADEINPNYLGRVHSNYLSLSILTMPIGLFLSGLFADIVGINIWFAISGILIILLTIFQLKFKFENKNIIKKIA